MAEYIDRELLFEILENEGLIDVDDVLLIETADVSPVIHAKWENTRNPYCGPNCSHCKGEAIQDDCNGSWFTTDFCPRCGAKMDL